MPIQWVKSDEMPPGQAKAFAALFEAQASEALIANAHTTMRSLQVSESLCFPVSINEATVENTFVCSPFTAYALYAQDELRMKVPNKLLQFPLLGLIRFLGFCLKLGQIDRNVHVNNFLLATNPYPEWAGEEIGAITAFIRQSYPKQAIVFRSLNLHQHQALIRAFEGQGYQKIGSRQVYIYDLAYADWLRHNNNKNDLRLIKKQGLQYLNHEQMQAYLGQALALYNLLYLDKYSRYNPQFTLTYFEGCYREKLIHFQGYADQNGQLKAFAGLFNWDETITSPLVGYDTAAPQKQGLYIHAIQLAMRYKFERGGLLNLSSGAAHFKRLRAGRPVIEYTLVYTRHLPFYRRLVWWFLQFMSNRIGIPLVQKYKL